MRRVENEDREILLEGMVAKAATGDTDAVCDLLRDPHVKELLDEVSRRAERDFKQESDDVRQYLAINIWLKIRTLKDPSEVRLRLWLYDGARGYCLNQLRYQKRQSNVVELGSLAPSAPSTPEEELSIAEQIRRATSSFPREIVDKWLGGMSPKQMARETGRPVTAIYRILRRMKKAIMLALETPPGEIEHDRTVGAKAGFPRASARPIGKGKNEPEESKLLGRANETLPAGLKSRLAALEEKRDAGSLTEPELSELISISDRVEQLHAERLEALANLAKLRGSTLTSVMDQLGIRFPDNA